MRIHEQYGTLTFFSSKRIMTYHSPSKTVILQLTSKTPPKWNCTKLGRPSPCNILINSGDLSLSNIVMNWEDPYLPIPYYVIHGQPLFNLVTLILHLMALMGPPGPGIWLPRRGQQARRRSRGAPTRWTSWAATAHPRYDHLEWND